MRPLSLCAWFCILGCGGGSISTVTDTGVETDTDTDTDADTDADTDTDTDTDTDVPCTIYSFTPPDGDSSVSVTVEPRAVFTQPVEQAAFSMSIDGVDGTATLATDGLSGVFTPDAPLAELTSYTARVSACGNDASNTFETAGSPITPGDANGRTYVLPWADLTFVEPPGASQFVGDAGIEFLLIESENVDEVNETIDLSQVTGVSDGNGGAQQDICTPVAEYPQADFSGNPVVEVGPENLSLQGVVIEDFYLAGAFNSDATAMEDVRIRGRIDTRSFGFSPCGFIDCVPCPDGVVECLTVLAVADRADWQDGLVVDPALHAPDDPSCQQAP